MAFEDDSPTIDCPHCGHTISAQARFCRRCGKTPKSAAPPVCATCGAVAEATDALFCSKCGAALASSATDSETRPSTVATPVRRSAPVEPLPLSSLPERRARKIWPWAAGLAIVAAGAVAVATQRGNLAAWLYVSSTPPPTKAMEAAISAYYRAIGNKDFETAYSLWTPSMQKGLAPDDLAMQWSSLGADSAHVNLSVSMSEPPNGDFVPTTVRETESYPDGYLRKKVLKGGWHVVNIGGRWLLNERDFKAVADNGPPPTFPVKDSMGAQTPPQGAEGATNQSIAPSATQNSALGDPNDPLSWLISPSDPCLVLYVEHHWRDAAGECYQDGQQSFDANQAIYQDAFNGDAAAFTPAADAARLVFIMKAAVYYSVAAHATVHVHWSREEAYVYITLSHDTLQGLATLCANAIAQWHSHELNPRIARIAHRVVQFVRNGEASSL